MHLRKNIQREQSFLVFSDDWGEHPSSCQHVFKHIAKTHKVLWVNTIGMRNPTFTKKDVKKIIYKVKKMFSDSGETSPTVPLISSTNLSVVQPFMLPFSSVPIIRQFNRCMVIYALKKKLAAFNIKKLFFVTTVPNACDYVGYCNEKKVIYYCVDDFAEWPGLEQQLISKMEQDLINKSDIFLATSNKLYHKLLRTNKPTYLLTHGVDLSFFNKKSVVEHDLLRNIPKPRVGYFGLFDDRSDKVLISEIAARLPYISFVITGKIETDISMLQKNQNIYFTGSVPYTELPAIVQGWDICFLPYLINNLTESINPLKLKEYLASGKPVVSTPIAEALAIKKMIYIAESAEEFKKSIEAILDKRTTKDMDYTINYLKNESWDKKAQFLMDLC